MRRKMSFTMVELLVVVAIILILSALLLPALNGARERSRTVKCAANQRQIGSFIHMYQNDNDDFIFPRLSAGTSGYSWPWQLMLNNRPGALSGSILLCPSKNNLYASYFQTGAFSGYSNYPDFGFNSNLYEVRTVKIKQPSRTISNADNYCTTTISLADHCGFYILYTGYSATPVNNRGPVEARHTNGSANFLWADGHVNNVVFDGGLRTWRTYSSTLHPYLFAPLRNATNAGHSDNHFDLD